MQIVPHAQYEVEQKFRLPDTDAISRLIARVAELGGAWQEPEQHADTYYAHPSRDFAVTDEALRIRSIGDHHLVTYKGPKINQNTKTRRELELPLNPPEFGPDELHELWQALGFTPVATVRKTRRTSKLISADWSFSVDLDQVDEVGSFVELDTSADESQIASAESALHELAGALELTNVVQSSYLCLLLESRGA